ncbi:thiamine phosphate synthase [Massilia sp. PWRC2]|uniref:thiamine phosphate synthase n=1 Tax=Massilia sp. PWRC2 TaxID=2804626 RepID=UPI003CF7D07C
MNGVYLVTPDWDDTAALLARTEQALQAGVAMLQYRHKGADPALRLQQAAQLLALCRRYAVPLIINDHIDVCMELGADGVHVGGCDASVAAARAQLGDQAIIGASCYGERALALRAAGEGASYVAYGGFYPSRVKQYAVTTAADIVDWSCATVTLPAVVIGGMTPANAAPLVARGAAMVAAISSVYGAPSAAAAVRQFRALFDGAGGHDA